jgi:hypothetical protein
MDGLVLDICGAVAIVMGGWRSYVVAREALGPLAHEGDPTRAAIEATRPFPLRPRVRAFAQRVAVSTGWLAIAFYGLYLLARGQGVPG